MQTADMSGAAARRYVAALSTPEEINAACAGETRPAVIEAATRRIRTITDLADYEARTRTRGVTPPEPVIVEPEPAPESAPDPDPEPISEPAAAIVAPEPDPDPDPVPAVVPEPGPGLDPFDGFAAPLPETARIRASRRRAAREAETGDPALPRYRAPAVPPATRIRAAPPGENDGATCPKCGNTGTVGALFGLRRCARPDGSVSILRQSYCHDCRKRPPSNPRTTKPERAPHPLPAIVLPDDGVI